MAWFMNNLTKKVTNTRLPMQLNSFSWIKPGRQRHSHRPMKVCSQRVLFRSHNWHVLRSAKTKAQKNFNYFKTGHKKWKKIVQLVLTNSFKNKYTFLPEQWSQHASGWRTRSSSAQLRRGQFGLTFSHCNRPSWKNGH